MRKSSCIIWLLATRLVLKASGYWLLASCHHIIIAGQQPAASGLKAVTSD
jgi:hypothetical protein